MKVVSALDARALLISKELEEARRLREEAEKVLADYRRKLGDVVTEVDNITALATTEAKNLAAETRQSLKEYFDRRIKLAEEKIARAEMEAVREFRSVAVDAAIAAAQNLIAAKLTPDRAKKARFREHQGAQVQAELTTACLIPSPRSGHGDLAMSIAPGPTDAALPARMASTEPAALRSPCSPSSRGSQSLASFQARAMKLC